MVMGPSDMFQRMPDDVLYKVLMRASFGDALRLRATCRAASSAPAITIRVDAVRRNLDRKRALMKELRMPWGFTSPRSLFYPEHACFMSERYVLITTERWTTPDFTPEAARESFNLNLALDPMHRPEVMRHGGGHGRHPATARRMVPRRVPRCHMPEGPRYQP